jgi:hypothetical protein
MTPNGMKAAVYDSPGLPIEQWVRENHGGQGFMTPPLSENDF